MQSHACMNYAEAMVLFEAKPQRTLVFAVGDCPNVRLITQGDCPRVLRC
ncbi:hypothetical protein SAMN06298211_1135 [Prevotellaceae bacterium MN60]|nr:hypothetical protein SAMN06298211_1135 [Prevotellaceae bacterium MN60]